MEDTRQIALRTYKDAISNGLQDSPMNWHLWKRAFDTAETELKNMTIDDKRILPTHEDIVKAGWSYYQNNGVYYHSDVAFVEGVKWFRDKML